jgi:thioesterase domain-containing protein
MVDTGKLSEARRALLEKYLRGESPHLTADTGNTDNTSNTANTSNAVDKVQSAKVEKAVTDESVVAIQTGGSRRPFFFLHGDWVSGAYWCFPLAHGLGPDQPFYALEPYRFDSLPPPLETIAAAHLQLMYSIQPEGPYFLGGFCNGALLAYEMARQLHKAGQKLDLLVLMDPMGLIYPARHRIAAGAMRWFGKLLRLSEQKQLYGYILLRHIHSYLSSSDYRKSKAIWPFKARNGESKPESVWSRLLALLPPIEAILQDYAAIYDWSAMLYKPPDLYPGKITFFWDSEEPFRRVGWRKARATNEIETHIIPGAQMACRTEYLPILTEHLRICLDKIHTTN